MKKNILFIALGLMIGSTVLTGCKKGENDPFLSLKSRDARITESWKLVSVEGTANDNGTLATDTYDGTIWSWTYGSFNGSYAYSLSIDISKDGTYQSVENNDGEITTTDGRWYWSNSAKNKTSITFDNLGTFEVNGLKSKELILKDYSKEVVSGTATDSYESTTTMTFEKQ
jgi:hypothetical protein